MNYRVAKATEFLTWTMDMEHGKFRKHLRRMRLISEPIGKWCDLEDETAKHILFACPAHTLKRLGAFGTAIIDVDMAGRHLLETVLIFIDQLDW